MPNDINSQITRITGNVAAAYTAALAKGATMPQNQNSDNLVDTIASIAIPQTQTKSATPSLSSQTITPDSGKLLSGVTVNPITAQLLANLDADFAASNIADGVDMFGVTGTLPKVYVGEFTPATKVKNITVSHGLGKMPAGCVVWPFASVSNSSLWCAFGNTSVVQGFVKSSLGIGSHRRDGSISDANAYSAAVFCIYDATQDSITFGNGGSGGISMDTVTYRFILW